MSQDTQEKKNELKEAVMEIKSGVAGWIFMKVQNAPTWALALTVALSAVLTFAQDAAESLPGLVWLIKLIDIPLLFIDEALIGGAGLLAALELYRRVKVMIAAQRAKLIEGPTSHSGE